MKYKISEKRIKELIKKNKKYSQMIKIIIGDKDYKETYGKDTVSALQAYLKLLESRPKEE